MSKMMMTAALCAAFLAQASASAATMSASLIPDGTYVVKVEKADAAHLTVAMQNGIETTLTAGTGVSFAKVKANQTVKLSVVKGKVPVFAVQ